MVKRELDGLTNRELAKELHQDGGQKDR